ncbi:hypothetical protein BWR17_03980 [Phaeobacter inhibens]|uniref:hypothetical protein n=1 Tax=Phaeobacter inhibens TaxID=221822 RepID=UPI000971A290|nr:hypothetical protein [Phaeobacter inhibens]APX15089.1 hypothetical protein BWR17_03980 [Phaeobacter inhibens]
MGHEAVKIYPEPTRHHLALVAANYAVQNGSKLRREGVFTPLAVSTAVEGAGQRPIQMIVHVFPVLIGI